jgi:hypothetical protein
VDQFQVTVNAAGIEKHQDKTIATRAYSKRVMKARRDRRAGNIPIMKGIREGTYDDEDDYAPTQGTIQAETKDNDIETQDTRVKKQKKHPRRAFEISLRMMPEDLREAKDLLHLKE